MHQYMPQKKSRPRRNVFAFVQKHTECRRTEKTMQARTRSPAQTIYLHDRERAPAGVKIK